MAKVGDKFIIEIDSVMTNKNGKLYGVKGFKSLVLDDYGVEQLQRVVNEGDGDSEEDNKEEAKKLMDAFDAGYKLGQVSGSMKILGDLAKIAREREEEKEGD